MKTYIVIPAYNEATSIGDVVRQVRAQFDHVVVIDDGSDDVTGATAADAGAEVLSHIINRGQGASLKTGIRYAMRHGAEVVVTYDADGQHDVNDIAKLIEPIRTHKADVTLGSRFLENTVENMPSVRRVMLKAAVIFTRFASGLQLTDTHNGLRAFTRTAIEKIKFAQDRMAHASEILDEIKRHHLRYVEVPVTIRYSEYSTAKGQSSLAFGKILVKYILGRILR